MDKLKLDTLSMAVAAIVSCRSKSHDPAILEKMVSEGLRNLHNSASSHRGEGKFFGHSHWSIEALEALALAEGKIRTASRELRHEHVVPANILSRCLLNIEGGATSSDYAELILRYSKVAIITRTQDADLRKAGLSGKMPEGWDYNDIWARYRVTGLYFRITTGWLCNHGNTELASLHKSDDQRCKFPLPGDFV